MTGVAIPGILDYLSDEDGTKSPPVPSLDKYIGINLSKFSLVIISCNKHERVNENMYSVIHKLTGEEASRIGMKISDDEFDQNTDIHCDICDAFYRPFCLEHPLYHIPDRELRSDSSDPVAIQSAPCLVQIKNSSIPNAGVGVFAFTSLPIGFVFGPYAGVIRHEESEILVDGYAWQIETEECKVYIDGADPYCSNWLRYINSPRNVEEQNLLAFQTNGKVFYRVIRPIMSQEELLVWYGNEFGKMFIPKCEQKMPRRARRNQFIL